MVTAQEIITRKIIDPAEDLEWELLRRAISDDAFRLKYRHLRFPPKAFDFLSYRGKLMDHLMHCSSYDEIMARCESWAAPENEIPVAEQIAEILFRKPLKEGDAVLISEHYNLHWPRTRCGLQKKAQDASKAGDTQLSERLHMLASLLRDIKPEEVAYFEH